MAVRNADADWEGALKDGKGKMKFGGGAFEGNYSYSSRLENGAGTNPEELLGAAHAGCFSMALSSGTCNFRMLSVFPPLIIQADVDHKIGCLAQ